ncbi:zinc finger transcription factor ace1 [Fusarium bulbicola]|nr:zinc finger transcription factor ace1 [Fusarium bulbicola]
MNTIADHVSACLQEFNSLCSSPTIWTESVSDEGTDSDISLRKLQNELSRFKVWSGNIGAHKKGRSSLDHRLRDASNIRDQVADLLEDLRESLKDAKDILTGQLTPWDQDLSLAGFPDDDSDDETLKFDAPGLSELSQIFSAIVEDINCLFRLSVSIHNPSPHDRFKKACLTDTSDYEPFDVQHVCNKLAKAPKPIAERLGKAISRRRQYFKYRELHHDKLANGLDLDDKDQMQSTVASSLPKRLNVNEPISLEEDLDDASDTVRSQTSWATSAANPERQKIPTLPAEAKNGPFECPFCFMMISIASRNHWKKHVFSDLFPYICVELGCPAPDQDFQRRHQWAGHVRKYHWKTWTCKLGCNETFDSSQDMKRHIEQKHPETTELTSLVSLLTMCERPRLEDEPADCTLCGERQSSFKQYQRHFGRHQEDLALFALPHLPGKDDQKNNEYEIESSVDDLDSEIQREQEAYYSDVTRLSDESGEEANNTAERNLRDSQGGGFAPVAAIDEIVDGYGLTLPESRPWKCPVSTCTYHHYGWFTEDDRDRHYREKHSETPAMYECMFKPCPYKSKRETNCKQHMEKAHGWTYIRPQKTDKKLPSISDMGINTVIKQTRKSLDTDSADESSEHAKEPTTHRRIEMKAPIVNRESFDPANVDVLHLRHEESLYTFKFPRHDIRDGKLRVSKIRELAAGMTHVPESFRHLVKLSWGDFRLSIDGTPIRNYGISSGHTIKVEAPQFRKSGKFSGFASDDLVLDDGRGTEGNMGLEGKAERDERRAEFSSELRQRAMVESCGITKAPASSKSQVELKGETNSKMNDVRKRTKTGCLTCRKRRIKCDEARPICNICIKTKRHCEGYSQLVSFGGSMGATKGVPVPEIKSNLEGMETTSKLSAEAGRKGVKTSEVGVRCPTCVVAGKEIWVVHGRCCGNCGTPCGDENATDFHDSFRATNVNDYKERFPPFTATGASGSNEEPLHSTPREPEKKQISCPSFSLHGYCMDGAECPYIHDPAMISTSDPSSNRPDTVEPLLNLTLPMNSNEINVWQALCALEDQLEMGWLPICTEAISSDDGSTKKREERLELMNGIVPIIEQLKRIEKVGSTTPPEVSTPIVAHTKSPSKSPSRSPPAQGELGPADDSDVSPLGHFYIEESTHSSSMILMGMPTHPSGPIHVGTGSGIWAIEFADRYPNTEVVGTDLSPCQPQWVPPNLRFEIDDATQPWTWKDDYFSFVHIRYLFGAIRDWSSLFSEAYRCCAPGGWVQSGEADVTFRSDDGTTELEPVFKTYQKLFEDGSQISGNPFFVHDLQLKAFEEAGFTDVETVDYKFPIGGWPKDSKLAEVGRFVKATLENDLEGYTLMMWQDVCQWPKDEYQVFLMSLRKAIRNPKVHSYMTVRYVYGRK